MKKFFAHPLFYGVFALLGLCGMGLQYWFLADAPGADGLLVPGHPALILTLVLLVGVLALAIWSCPHIRTPQLSVPIRSAGAALGGIFCAVAAVVLLQKGNYLSFILCVLSTISSFYILCSQLRHRKPHFASYAVFALCFMFYLISRYRVYSAEPETARYAFKILALVCTMLVFYQQAAIRAGTGRFASYHIWRSMTLFLTLTAMPSSGNPMLYLSAAMWLLVDPLPRPKAKEEGK